MKLEHIKSYYIINGLCLFIVCVILTFDLPKFVTLPQVTEMTRPLIEPVSWTTEEDLGQSVEVHREGAARVPTVTFEAGQMMQWPDIKSDGVMIDGIMLESEMSPVGSVRDEAEPVSLAAKSELLTPVVFAGGGGRCCGSPPGRGRGSHSASFCPTSGWK